MLHRLAGNWLREEYIAALEQTKAPSQAVRGLYEVQAVLQQNANRKYELNLIYHFHESIAREIKTVVPMTQNEFTIRFATPYGSGRDEYRIRIDNPARPSLLTLEYPKGRFRFRKNNEPSAEDFVNRQVLAGQYRDVSGGKYVFGSSQTAQWPRQSFRYRVGLDYVFSQTDYFSLVDAKDNHLGVFFSYEWKDGKLYIYKAAVPQGEAVAPAKEPLLILEKSNP